MLGPKNEEEDKLITEVLISMADDGVLDPKPQTQPNPSAPSFSLNLGFPTPPITEAQPPATLEEEFPLTARTMAVINNMDELISAPEPTTATPQPTKTIKDDFDDRVATLATMPKGGNDYEPIFKLRGPQFLQAIRYQFMSMEPKSYIDIGVVGLMCHMLNGEEGDRYEKLVYCLPPDLLSNIMNQLLKWAGAPSILKKGSWSLPTRYVNIPQQPNNHDCAVFVMKWMELIDPTKLAGCCTYDIEQWTEPMLNEFRKKIVTKIIMSKENSMRADAITAVQNMRVARPGASLRSPFMSFSTPDLPTN
ncbi:hypothetical protein PIB30_030464 [Stylosanthes scabra]|uniref:Ubiquitin-like protease family profile domain-containing protein n=1 Tax=Stylosanthes scabra TaxID=79078 RepID=A0ABU6UAB2_9FABA|nr:hypothetical protein [Stylosanthes scabra]